MDRNELADGLDHLKMIFGAIQSSQAWLDLKAEQSRRNGPDNLNIRDSTERDLQDQHDSFLAQLAILRNTLTRNLVRLSADDRGTLEAEISFMEKEVAALDLSNQYSRARPCW
jgi:hypothetical protein